MTNHKDPAALIEQLRDIVGNEHVILDMAERQLLSNDLSFMPAETAVAILKPGTAEELSRAVGAITRAGFNALARGGGMSYTGGYIPEKPDTVLIDMRRMDRILEINTDDMYVTVECGCTWKTLFEALQPLGVRTPYFGPLSGLYATVGGALSQNSMFLGSGIYHTVAESVLSMSVVLGDGRMVTTGSGAHQYSRPFFRYFGPDFTGLFCADNGAFGFKASATFRLIRTPPSTAYMSFRFDSLDQMLVAQTEIARLKIAAECYGFDPYYNAGFEKLGFTYKEGIAIIGKVARSGGIKGLFRALRVASGGQRILRDIQYSMHMTFDAISDIAANEALEAARAICIEAGGSEFDNTLPTVFRAQPFGPVRTLLLGFDGEIWMPLHGMFPLSRAREAGEATEAFLAGKRDILERNNIRTSYLTAFSGNEFIIEPSFYWRDELGAFRLSLIEPEFQDKWKGFGPDHDKRALVLGLRRELATLYDKLGACHQQIGKFYDYSAIMAPETWDMVKAFKAFVDPEGTINPGSLGLR